MANKWQFPEGMGHIHAVTDDKLVGTIEANEVCFERHGPLAGLVEQHDDRSPPRAAREQEIAGIGKCTPGFENIIND